MKQTLLFFSACFFSLPAFSQLLSKEGLEFSQAAFRTPGQVINYLSALHPNDKSAVVDFINSSRIVPASEFLKYVIDGDKIIIKGLKDPIYWQRNGRLTFRDKTFRLDANASFAKNLENFNRTLGTFREFGSWKKFSVLQTLFLPDAEAAVPNPASATPRASLLQFVATTKIFAATSSFKPNDPPETLDPGRVECTPKKYSFKKGGFSFYIYPPEDGEFEMSFTIGPAKGTNPEPKTVGFEFTVSDERQPIEPTQPKHSSFSDSPSKSEKNVSLKIYPPKEGSPKEDPSDTEHDLFAPRGLKVPKDSLEVLAQEILDACKGKYGTVENYNEEIKRAEAFFANEPQRLKAQKGVPTSETSGAQ